MSVTDQLLQNAQQYAAHFDKGDLPMPPATHLAVVACMDARLNVYGVLGLSEATPTSSATRAGCEARHHSATSQCALGRSRTRPPRRSVIAGHRSRIGRRRGHASGATRELVMYEREPLPLTGVEAGSRRIPAARPGSLR
jgi:hypothetical protein